MSAIRLELSMKEFQSLKIVLEYIIDNEREHYEDCVEEDHDVFVDDHVYAHALNISKAFR